MRPATRFLCTCGESQATDRYEDRRKGQGKLFALKTSQTSALHMCLHYEDVQLKCESEKENDEKARGQVGLSKNRADTEGDWTAMRSAATVTVRRATMRDV